MVNEKQPGPIAAPASKDFCALIDEAKEVLQSLQPLEDKLRQAAAHCISSLKGGTNCSSATTAAVPAKPCIWLANWLADTR